MKIIAVVNGERITSKQMPMNDVIPPFEKFDEITMLKMPLEDNSIVFFGKEAVQRGIFALVPTEEEIKEIEAAQKKK